MQRPLGPLTRTPSGRIRRAGRTHGPGGAPARRLRRLPALALLCGVLTTVALPVTAGPAGAAPTTGTATGTTTGTTAGTPTTPTPQQQIATQVAATVTTLATQPGTSTDPSALAAVAAALKEVGKPYQWGGTGPDSFDCSGLVQVAYRAAGLALPRVAADQYAFGAQVPLAQARAGDLVFRASDVTDPTTVYHVAIYLGQGKVVEAPRTGLNVRVVALDSGDRLPTVARPSALLKLPAAQGASGWTVRQIQTALNRAGAKLTVDGGYGPLTAAAVTAYQASAGLPATGTTDVATWASLIGAPAPTATPGPDPSAAQPAAVVRVAGPTREATAVAVSQRAYPSGGSARGVVLARADDYPDALAGAPLAASLGGPLLLTPPTGLAASTADEIKRVLPPGGTVTLLGGPASLAPSIDAQLGAWGYRTARIAGGDRYATAVMVAKVIGTPKTLLLATGTDFADALAAGTAAAGDGGAVLLTAGMTLPPATAAYLAARTDAAVYTVGGPAATAYPAGTALRGADRYATAAAVAARFAPNPTTVGVASGGTFPDALAAAPLLGSLDAPLLLTAGAALPGSSGDYLAAHRSSLTAVQVFGGTASVADGVRSQILGQLTG